MGPNIYYCLLFLFFKIFVCFSCPPWHSDYSISKDNNRTCYKIYTYKASFYDAKRICEADNGLVTRNKVCDLPIMPTANIEEDSSFIAGLLMTELNKLVPADTRFWITELTKNPKGNCSAKHYQGEKCFSYSKKDGVIEEDCETLNYFICYGYINYVECVENSFQSDAHKKWKYSSETKFCYMPITVSYSFNLLEKSSLCSEYGANLASVHSKIEDHLIHEISTNYVSDNNSTFNSSYYTLLGYTYDEISKWEWLDGTEQDYKNAYIIDNICVVIKKKFKSILTVNNWSNLNCSEKAIMAKDAQRPILAMCKKYPVHILTFNEDNEVFTKTIATFTSTPINKISSRPALNLTINPEMINYVDTTSVEANTTVDTNYVDTTSVEANTTIDTNYVDTTSVEANTTVDTTLDINIIIVICVTVVLFLSALSITIIIWITRKYKIKMTRMSFYNSILYSKFHKMATARNRPNFETFNKGEIPEKDLRIHLNLVLGCGEFAIVCKGSLDSSNREFKRFFGTQISKLVRRFHTLPREVAVKIAKTNQKNSLLREIEVMKNIQYHPHILILIGYVRSNGSLMLIMEYCSNQDLLNYLQHNRIILSSGSELDQLNYSTKKLLISFAWQICDGMVYLNSKGFLHRDLAARNIFLTDELVVKIGDFGLCQTVNNENIHAAQEKFPIKWLAIESMKYQIFSTSSDIWSYGILLYEIFTFGETPYKAIEQNDLLDFLSEGNRLEKPTFCPENIYNLMASCWFYDPHKRPSFEQLRQELRRILEAGKNYGYIELIKNYGIVYQKLQK